MRTLQLLLPLLALCSFGIAQNSNPSLAIGQLPTCALSCLITAAAESPCDLSNSTCMCNDHRLQSGVEKCVLKSCTLRQGLTTKNITSTACNAPIRYKDGSTKATNIAFKASNTVLFVMRITYQAFFSAIGLGWDDYSMIVTWLIGIPSLVITNTYLLPSGIGRDVWTLSFGQITDFAHWLYTLEILYVLQLTMLKLTLLLLLLRIFPRKPTRRLLWATAAFNLVWGLAFLLATAFQCQPISSAWTSWDEEGSRKCVNINALCWAHAIISIMLDLWMLALPLYEVFQLQMSWRKKFSVTIMFCVGTLFTVVSIFRLQSLVVFANSRNPTLDQSDVLRWSSLELHIGMACASLPALRNIVGYIRSKFRGPATTVTHSYSRDPSTPGLKRGVYTLGSTLDVTTLTDKDSDTAYGQEFDTAPIGGDETCLLKMDVISRVEPKAQISTKSFPA